MFSNIVSEIILENNLTYSNLLNVGIYDKNIILNDQKKSLENELKYFYNNNDEFHLDIYYGIINENPVNCINKKDKKVIINSLKYTTYYSDMFEFFIL